MTRSARKCLEALAMPFGHAAKQAVIGTDGRVRSTSAAWILTAIGVLGEEVQAAAVHLGQNCSRPPDVVRELVEAVEFVVVPS